jgi:para-nitrobenzyl esterase
MTATEQPTAVQTSLGAIQGSLRDNVHQFRGIRFAQAPTGDLRFRAPVPVEPWDGVLAATTFGNTSPQPARLPGNPLPARAIRNDEDCLFLNVYTPATDDQRRPVLVWIHGGAYTAGSGDAYDGTPFCRQGDMVVVTVNYRLGVLGFMELGHLDPTLAGSQNNGIRDQIAALQWVHDHIAAFGGDPDRVTICGESAGAGSVAALLGSPGADHLYHQAIAQSAPVSFAPTSSAHADKIVEAAGGLEALKNASIDEILAAQTGVAEAAAAGRHVVLIGDGRPGLHPALDAHTVTRNPIDAVAELGPDSKPLMLGTNVDEGTLFSMYLPKGITDEEMLTALAGHTSNPAGVAGAFRKTYPDETPRQLMTRMLTDTMFRTGSLQLADAQSEAGGTVYNYLFTWASEGFGGRLGSMHALEIPFVWNGDLTAWAPIMGEGEPWPTDLSDRMHPAWISFVQTGNPSHAAIGEWPTHNVQSRLTMEFGVTSSVLEDPFGLTRAAWAG